MQFRLLCELNRECATTVSVQYMFSVKFFLGNAKPELYYIREGHGLDV